jgi:hypothetical protein
VLFKKKWKTLGETQGKTLSQTRRSNNSRSSVSTSDHAGTEEAQRLICVRNTSEAKRTRKNKEKKKRAIIYPALP